MVAEAGTIALSGTTMYLLYRIMESLGLNEEALESGSNYTSLVQLYMISLVYPLQLASVVTSASCRRLKLNIPDCSTWRGVYHQLTVMGQQYRGQNMFYRKAY
ncbi:hypothetical protein EB796_013289 [Bugula neritina]|uniref:Uncharacterized protein n=1 Tax=Bugula neritina TaxID=10212 RepID=A0A7J7JPX9_BUGNE|nr:hypothetical protein EB796_013289 [Bugula neritina]